MWVKGERRRMREKECEEERITTCASLEPS
jgi:hypothetical protein